MSVIGASGNSQCRAPQQVAAAAATTTTTTFLMPLMMISCRGAAVRRRLEPSPPSLAPSLALLVPRALDPRPLPRHLPRGLRVGSAELLVPRPPLPLPRHLLRVGRGAAVAKIKAFGAQWYLFVTYVTGSAAAASSSSASDPVVATLLDLSSGGAGRRGARRRTAADVVALLHDPQNLRDPTRLSAIAASRGLVMLDKQCTEFAERVLVDEAAWKMLKAAQYHELQKRLRGSQLARAPPVQQFDIQASVPPIAAPTSEAGRAVPAPLNAIGSSSATITIEPSEMDQEAAPAVAAAAAPTEEAPAAAPAKRRRAAGGAPRSDADESARKAARRERRAKAEKQRRESKANAEAVRVSKMTAEEMVAYEGEQEAQKSARAKKRKQQRSKTKSKKPRSDAQVMTE